MLTGETLQTLMLVLLLLCQGPSTHLNRPQWGLCSLSCTTRIQFKIKSQTSWNQQNHSMQMIYWLQNDRVPSVKLHNYQQQQPAEKAQVDSKSSVNAEDCRIKDQLTRRDRVKQPEVARPGESVYRWEVPVSGARKGTSGQMHCHWAQPQFSLDPSFFFCSIPSRKSSPSHFQAIQNAATRILMFSPKWAHIIPALYSTLATYIQSTKWKCSNLLSQNVLLVWDWGGDGAFQPVAKEILEKSHFDFIYPTLWTHSYCLITFVIMFSFMLCLNLALYSC